MSLVDQLKSLLAKRKPAESELDSRLSLATPDGAADTTATETVVVTRGAPLDGANSDQQGIRGDRPAGGS